MAAGLHSDADRILAFAYCYPERCFHVVDLPYRLCSPSAQEATNRRLWENSAGEVVAFAVIQQPFATLDWAVRPGDELLVDEIMQWAMLRLEAIAIERGSSFGFLFDSLTEHDPIAEKYGFEPDGWYMRRMALDAPVSLARPELPAGFVLRPLNGKSEVMDYTTVHRAAFGTQNMTAEWRARTVEHPAYQPDLDLVVTTEEGQLVAFCVGWMALIKGEWIGQIEPLGVLPELQGLGLGRAILLENLRRMRARGVSQILIDAESYNPASLHLYESVGFREVYRTEKYFREFGLK